MRACSDPIHDLLPHKPPMVLLDHVLGWDEDALDAEIKIRPGIPFYREGSGVPAHVGIEYMAQACGAYVGLEAKLALQPVRLGFLLGTRHYRATTAYFGDGERLAVHVQEILRETEIGVFDCRISVNGDERAAARLNLYQPTDLSRVLAKKAQP